MTEGKAAKKSANVSDDAVRAATGKDWNAWFAVLDRGNATRMTHREIVAYLGRYRSLSDWWRQMVTVAYEQSRGLRAKHERPDGFSVSRSKTLPLPVASLYDCWMDVRSRARWMGKKPLKIRKATRNKSIRITWVDGKTSVEVDFYSKGESKSQVTVQHNKLSSAAEARKMKAFWGEVLESLENLER